MSPRPLRVLNAAGVDRFRTTLARMRRDASTPPPFELLDDPEYSEAPSVDVELAPARFANRLTLARYLCTALEPIPFDEIERNRGLWAWLSLWLFDTVCPPRADGGRRPGQTYRHIPDFSYRHRHRHLLLGPYELFRRHGPRALVLLTSAPHEATRLYQDIASRRDLVANAGVIEAALLLYMDRRTASVRRGVHSDAVPGNVRRFIRVLQQLDLNFDIYGMTGRQIVALLPAEFDEWREKR